MNHHGVQSSIQRCDTLSMIVKHLKDKLNIINTFFNIVLIMFYKPENIIHPKSVFKIFVNVHIDNTPCVVEISFNSTPMYYSHTWHIFRLHFLYFI